VERKRETEKGERAEEEGRSGNIEDRSMGRGAWTTVHHVFMVSW